MDMRLISDPQYPDAKSPNEYQNGMEYQDFVCTQLAKCGIVLQNLMSKKYQYHVGENLQGFEIKLDRVCTRSGQLSIEIAEKTRNAESQPWIPSGIYRSDNSWLYIQGNYEIIFIFAKNWLQRWHKVKRPQETEKHGTIRTFYIRFDEARKAAAKVIDIAKGSQESHM